MTQRGLLAACLPLAFAATGCHCNAFLPPKSQVPDAESAIGRMRETLACGRALQATAKLDHSGDRGRIRGELLLFAARPASLRMAIPSPVGVTMIATLTSDGKKFAFADMRENRFFVGPAQPCNIARLTTVPVPGHVMVDLLRGEAPILKHNPAQATISWVSAEPGYYRVTIPSTRDAVEVIHLSPPMEDREKPWSQQRMRVLDVEVKQQEFVLYHAKLDEHLSVPMAKELPDPNPIPGEPSNAVPVSGPVCTAEVPRRIELEVPAQGDDVRFRYEEIVWNPPMPDGTFRQETPPGMAITPVGCD